MKGNTEKEFFQKNSVGQIFSGEYYSNFLKLHGSIVSKGKDCFIKFSKRFNGGTKSYYADLFGKHAFVTTDSSKRNIYVWKINLKNGTLWILNGANGRGTSYEWHSEQNKYHELYNEVIEFLFNKYEIDV